MRPAGYLRRIAAVAILLAIQVAPGLAASRDLRACLDHDDKDRARAACGRVLDPGSGASRSDRIRAYESRAVMHYGADDSAAAAEYQAAVDLDPKNIHLRQKLGDSHLQAYEYQAALEAYGAILRLQPGNIDALSARADAYLKSADPDRAIDDYDLILRLKPRYESALVGRGIALGAKGDFDGAVNAFDKALAINRNSFGRLFKNTTVRAREEFGECNAIRAGDQPISAAAALHGMNACSAFLNEGVGNDAQKGRAIVHRAALYRVWRDLNPP
jgi:tetratricopeptide (TPR) repeat protein